MPHQKKHFLLKAFLEKTSLSQIKGQNMTFILNNFNKNTLLNDILLILYIFENDLTFKILRANPAGTLNPGESGKLGW